MGKAMPFLKTAGKTIDEHYKGNEKYESYKQKFN